MCFFLQCLLFFLISNRLQLIRDKNLYIDLALSFLNDDYKGLWDTNDFRSFDKVNAIDKRNTLPIVIRYCYLEKGPLFELNAQSQCCFASFLPLIEGVNNLSKVGGMTLTRTVSRGAYLRYLEKCECVKICSFI